jgi:hypothetical protein
MTANAFAVYWFVFAPAAWLCLQYGWDMVVDEFVPVAREED